MKGKNLLIISAAVIIGLLFNAKIFAAVNDTPLGYWQTVDDKTGKILSIVKIYSAPDQTLEGKIVKIMPVLGQKPNDLCTQCKGHLYNLPMLNLKIIWGMQQINGTTWGKGRVLDPKSGNIYKGNMTLMNASNNLRLRGYLGIPAFGRSEIWNRIAKP